MSSNNTSAKELARLARDFGGMVHKTAKGVYQVENGEELARLVERIGRDGQHIVARGQGHSQGGQSLTSDGWVLDMTGLDGIEEIDLQRKEVVVDAGTTWEKLLDRTAQVGLQPTVLTDYLDVTVGGTLSVGGLGAASFRYGPQVKHVRAMEVVLGDGRRHWVSAEKEPEQFDGILGTLGRVGLITRVKLALRPLLSHVQIYRLSYENYSEYIDDIEVLRVHEDVHYLEGFVIPSPPNATHPYLYMLEIAREVPDDAPAEPEWRRALQDVGSGESMVMETCAYARRVQGAYPRPAEAKRLHPWVEFFLPQENVPEFLRGIAPHFPDTSLLFWPMPDREHFSPMMALPLATPMVLVGILNEFEAGEREPRLAGLQLAHKLGTRLGGKRYLSGWLPFDMADWQAHFGNRWQELESLRKTLDPHGVLPSWPIVDPADKVQRILPSTGN